MGLSFDPPRAVALCIPRLYGGGAEKVMAHMADWWAERGVHVYLLTFHDSPQDIPLHPGVRRILLDELQAQTAFPFPEWSQESNNINILKTAFLNVLHQENAERLPVISFLARMNMRCLLAAQGLPCRVIVSERCYPPAVFLGEHDEELRKHLYPKADALVVQSEYTWEHWGREIVPPEQCHVIPNPFPATPACSDYADNLTPPHHLRYFLAVGRLTRQKRHDLLLHAFVPLRDADPRIHLYIIGDGPRAQSLIELCQALNLQENVTFLGQMKNVRQWMRNAIALVHTADHEGFPNVILEALAEHCPVIATNCPTGPAEMITHGVNGFLTATGNSEEVTKYMHLLTNPAIRHSICETLKKNLSLLSEKYSLNNVMQSWSALLALDKH